MGGGSASLKAAAPGAATFSPLGSGSLEDPICAWIQKDSQEQHEERFTELPIHGICHLWPALLEVDHGRRLLNSFRNSMFSNFASHLYDGVAATEGRRNRGVGGGRVEGLLQV